MSAVHVRVRVGDKVLFLDRDGVVNEHIWPAPRRWAQFRFLPGVPEALSEATRAGWRIVVATNKGSVGVHLLSRAVSDEINDRMVAALAEHGARIEKVYACNHFPHGLCPCRKPKPGMLVQARQELDLDPDVCWMVGDSATDVAAGAAVGCRTVLLTTRRTRSQLEAQLRRIRLAPDVWAPDLPTAWRESIRDSSAPAEP